MEIKTIGDIVTALAETGITTQHVAKEMGIAKDRLQNGLKRIGVTAVNKVWEYRGEGESPYNQPIEEIEEFTAKRRRTTPTTRQKPQEATEEPETTKLVGGVQNEVENETEDILGVLKDIIQKYDRGTAETTTGATESIDHLFVRIKREVLREKKTRRTINVGETVGSKMDAFVKEHRIDKQDFIEIAIWDLLNRYK